MTLEIAAAAKARQLREYFSRHGRIYIVVNAMDDSVVVPERLRGDPALRLVLNVRMPQVIHIRDEALESDFSFSGGLFHCSIPMPAIWAAYVPEQQIGNGILWEDDVPEAIRDVIRAVRSMREEGSGTEAGNVRTAGLPAGDEQPENSAAKQAGGRRVGHLRVVK